MLKRNTRPTKIRPVVVCPDMSSPAQSFASVIHPISGSDVPRKAFCPAASAAGPVAGGQFFALSTVGLLDWRQQIILPIRHIIMTTSPVVKVTKLDDKNTFHWWSWHFHLSSRLVEEEAEVMGSISLWFVQLTSDVLHKEVIVDDWFVRDMWFCFIFWGWLVAFGCDG